MNIQLLNTFKAWLFFVLLIPTTAKALDDDWGTATVYVGETTTVYMSSSMQNIMDSPYTINISYNWSSNNTGIAQVISSSLKSCTVKGLREGQVRINCSLSYTTEMGYGVGIPSALNGYIILTVKKKVPVSQISISPSTTCLAPGDNVQLTATVYPNNAFDKTITWSSSNTDVVTVDNTGKLQAIGYGNATITCSATDGSGVTGTCEVTVVDKVPVTSITLSDTQLSLGKNYSQSLYATVLPDNATDKDLIWESSNKNVATIYNCGLTNDGRYVVIVEAQSIGSATITCSAQDGSGVQAHCTVNVYKHPDGDVFTMKSIEGIDISYWVKDATSGTCIVLGVDENAIGTVTIPNTADGLTVIQIGNLHPVFGSGITQVNLPSNVERIGRRAFDSSSISSIALDNVKYIGEEAFFSCSSLTKITGITNLEYIGSLAFYNTPWYDKLPDGLLYLGKVLYCYKGHLSSETEVNVKEGTVSISPAAFNYINLVSISIPKSVSNISSSSFITSWGNDLREIVIDSDNETYDSRDNCNAVIEKKSNTLIAGCKGTIIPETISAIGEEAFYNTPITTITIPNGVESIGNRAFHSSDLTSIHVGNGLRKLGNRVFSGCSNLNIITVSEDNPYFDSRNGCNAIIDSQTDCLLVGTHHSTIPQTVRGIGEFAFNTSTDKIESIRIPDGVETIGESAFYLQKALHSVTIGSGVKEIGAYAFSGCDGLTNIYSLITKPFTIGNKVFETYHATLYVPTGTMIDYMTTEGWCDFDKILEFDPDCIETIKKDANSNSPIFSLSGQRLSAPRKGINIIGGKKVVVR